MVAQHVLRIDRVERQLHLIDRHAVGRKLDRAANVVAPVVPRFADHAGDQIDVDVGKIGIVNPIPRFLNFGRQMGPAVFFEHRIAEILDAQAQPRDAQLCSVWILGSESVPGSHSKVTSSAWSQLMLARSRSTSDVSCLALRNEGVPPPK